MPITAHFERSTPKRVLIIITRRIGDVLLATPLIHSIKSAWPQAKIDVLVFASTASVLAGNPHINNIICIAERPSLKEHLILFKQIYRSYDLAVSTLTSDRPTLYAWIAGKCRVGLLEDTPKQHWKRKLLNAWVAFDNVHIHTIAMYLALTKPLNITPAFNVILTWNTQQATHVSQLTDINTPYAVLHVYPKFSYKMWHEQGWIDLANWLISQNIKVVLTGSLAPDEMLYIKDLFAKFPAGSINLSGKLNLNETAYLLTHAKVYIGPDTSISHIAAAMGTPSVALFGPTNPVKWGPWPKGYTSEKSPWTMTAPYQKNGNVLLLQGLGDCVPCHEEGCDKHKNSESRCMNELPASRVITALNILLTPSN